MAHPRKNATRTLRKHRESAAILIPCVAFLLRRAIRIGGALVQGINALRLPVEGIEDHRSAVIDRIDQAGHVADGIIDVGRDAAL